jgi:hypothetical protein
MAKILAKRIKDEMKHACKLAELELRKVELASHTSHSGYSLQHGIDFCSGPLTLKSVPDIFDFPTHPQ